MTFDVVWVPYIVAFGGLIGIVWAYFESRRLDRENEKAERERLTPR